MLNASVSGHNNRTHYATVILYGMPKSTLMNSDGDNDDDVGPNDEASLKLRPDLVTLKSY